MPSYKNRTLLELTRNISLFLHVELGLTGIEGTVDNIRSRLGLKPSARLLESRSPQTSVTSQQAENGAHAQPRKPVSTRPPACPSADTPRSPKTSSQAGPNLSYQQENTSTRLDIPIPPLEMRQLVGPTDAEAFDNPTGKPIFPFLPDSVYETVFDFGCGCGRIARQLLQQEPRPNRYVGVDIHRSMIEWCQNNLTPADPNFQFRHHDVYNPSHAPDNTHRLTAPFEVEDSAFSLVIAWSVFTHIYERQALYYLKEISRILRPYGQLVSTWFLFDKREFPMMQDFQNTLFINEKDPTNAVIFDREWVRKAVTESGLVITDIDPPNLRGFQWRVTMTPQKPETESIDFPPDEAPYGSMPPPLMPQLSSSLEEEPAPENRES